MTTLFNWSSHGGQNEDSVALSESYTADDRWIVRSKDGGQRGDKRLITPPPRWVSAQLLYVYVTAW